MRLAEHITAQVSELTSSMIEHIFAMRMTQTSRKTIKEEVVKEIGAELQRFQRKYEEGRQLINNMRKNFMKEISHLKSDNRNTTGGG